ncbi:YqaA family protein [Ghiorsea bivora]|uniref:YqaA family protein n=1 Tax=Ghiorsea bivora TaxID=1485545 RepID=UPI0005714CD1|nr:YqaA family protein [Ghiorsea bivora]
MIWFTQLDWTLFFSALISSTLFPGGSEALLIFRLQDASSNPYLLVTIATSGNVLGSIITYYMGKYGFQFSHKWFHISLAKQQQAENYFKKWGTPALLFAWLPIIGDPLCLVAGALRYHIYLFIVLVGIGKLARYTLLAWAFI